jgi:HTH-type transcriptional regulator/antitoxin HigA
MENIRPIKTEADYDWAIAEIAAYFEKQPDLGTPEAARFDVLATLIEAYEDIHYPMSPPDPVEAIKAHMEMSGRTRKDLADVLGSAPRASEVLNRRRALTLEMAYRLNRKWGIPAELLIQPYRLAAG